MPKLAVTYLLVQAVSLIVFWFFLDSAHALGYTILFIGVLQPLTILILSGFLLEHFCAPRMPNRVLTIPLAMDASEIPRRMIRQRFHKPPVGNILPAYVLL